MIAYLKSAIEAIKINDALHHWKENNLISEETVEKINQTYRKELYSPNIFIRIALFLFTCILLSASLGLLTLIFQGAWEENGIGIRLIIYGSLTLGALEFFIQKKRPYRAGIDDALLYSALGLYLSGSGILIFNNIPDSYGIQFFLLFSLPVLMVASIRYVDMLVSAFAYCCLIAIFFFQLMKIGTFMLSVLPFVGMLISAVIYFQSRKFQQVQYLAWWNNLFLLEFLSLLTFYLSGNYFVVNELSLEILGRNHFKGNDIPFAYVFYAFTLLIPVLYIVKSILHKDRMLLRTGLLILALGVLTFKYYFSLGHHEITLTVSGTIMIAVAWALTRYLKTPQHGFTSLEDKTIMNTDIEAFVITESIGKGVNTGGKTDGVEFGEGSSGGGGSSGRF